MLRSITHRLHSDFFMPSRIKEFDEIVREAMDNNYKIVSVLDFWNFHKQGILDRNIKYIVLRHDIDTDLRTTRKLWAVLSKYNHRSSYYFRLSTIDTYLMREIESSGSEVSYHYEELSNYCKIHKIKTLNQIKPHDLEKIKIAFKDNFLYFQSLIDKPIITIASHGDWVNRKLKVYNWEILKDNNLRKELGIELEVYDREIMDFFKYRTSDASFPSLWKNGNPVNYIKQEQQYIYILLHPRHWEVNRRINLVDDLNRLSEEIRYRL